MGCLVWMTTNLSFDDLMRRIITAGFGIVAVFATTASLSAKGDMVLIEIRGRVHWSEWGNLCGHSARFLCSISR
jgi:hypothetical protein